MLLTFSPSTMPPSLFSSPFLFSSCQDTLENWIETLDRHKCGLQELSLIGNKLKRIDYLAKVPPPLPSMVKWGQSQ
jgi:hypothetical protein